MVYLNVNADVPRRPTFSADAVRLLALLWLKLGNYVKSLIECASNLDH